jgi:hypothetical protein
MEGSSACLVPMDEKQRVAEVKTTVVSTLTSQRFRIIVAVLSALLLLSGWQFLIRASSYPPTVNIDIPLPIARGNGGASPTAVIDAELLQPQQKPQQQPEPNRFFNRRWQREAGSRFQKIRKDILKRVESEIRKLNSKASVGKRGSDFSSAFVKRVQSEIGKLNNKAGGARKRGSDSSKALIPIGGKRKKKCRLPFVYVWDHDCRQGLGIDAEKFIDDIGL